MGAMTNLVTDNAIMAFNWCNSAGGKWGLGDESKDRQPSQRVEKRLEAFPGANQLKRP